MSTARPFPTARCSGLTPESFPTSRSRLRQAGLGYRLGDTLTVQWTYTGGINHTVFLDLSLDGGKSFPVLIKPTPFPIVTENCVYQWVIPNADSLLTTNALIGINDYIVGGPSGTSAIFSIVPANSAIRQALDANQIATLALQGRMLNFPVTNMPNRPVTSRFPFST